MTAAPKSASTTGGVIPLEKTTTNAFREWLANRTRDLLSETLRFSQVRLP